MEDRFLTATGAALLFSPPLSATRVRQLVDEGLLPAIRTASGVRLIRARDVQCLIEQRRSRGPEKGRPWMLSTVKRGLRLTSRRRTCWRASVGRRRAWAKRSGYSTKNGGASPGNCSIARTGCDGRRGDAPKRQVRRSPVDTARGGRRIAESEGL